MLGGVKIAPSFTSLRHTVPVKPLNFVELTGQVSLHDTLITKTKPR
jgi:hypothetical protein